MAQLQAEREAMRRGLTLAEQLCDVHICTQQHGPGSTGSACAAEVLQLLDAVSRMDASPAWNAPQDHESQGYQEDYQEGYRPLEYAPQGNMSPL